MLNVFELDGAFDLFRLLNPEHSAERAFRFISVIDPCAFEPPGSLFGIRIHRES